MKIFITVKSGCVSKVFCEQKGKIKVIGLVTVLDCDGEFWQENEAIIERLEKDKSVEQIWP